MKRSRLSILPPSAEQIIGQKCPTVKTAVGVLLSRTVKKTRHEELPIIAFRHSARPPIRPGHRPAIFAAKPRPGPFVDKQAVLAAISYPDPIIINAIGRQFDQGLEPCRCGRAGRVPVSVTVPAAAVIVGVTHARSGRKRRSSQ
jgi:hypothetical protein